jgi:branched-chain amino acid transport system ATP-binding protein
MKLLEIKKLNTGYGKLQVIFDLNLTVDPNEIVAVIGPNGSGKSTILKAICGLLPVWSGDVLLNGLSLKTLVPSARIKEGLSFSPQGNRVFIELSVHENLEMGGFLLDKNTLQNRIATVLDFFPELRKRLNQNAGTLSGGEQQILALARVLVSNPKLLMLDEPSLGLSPALVKHLFQLLEKINQTYHIPILIVEQKVNEVLSLAKRVYSIKLGKTAFEGSSDSLKNNKTKLKELFL